MRRVCVVSLLCLVLSLEPAAQIAVFDPAVTARNSVTASVEELLWTTELLQHSQLRRMAQRLSLFTDLSKYVLAEPPRWRTHDWGNPDHVSVTNAYLSALTYGDASGAAYLAVRHPFVTNLPPALVLSPSARSHLLARLATVEATDSSILQLTHDSGALRFNGRRELDAIEALERHVVDPSLEQSATAVLDKISGAALIAGRQRQARVQLLAGVVEQLLIDTKRARDADTAAMNMQLTTWRAGRAANEAFVAGSGNAMRTWRQP
jgi:hypothetical protein